MTENASDAIEAGFGRSSEFGAGQRVRKLWKSRAVRGLLGYVPSLFGIVVLCLVIVGALLGPRVIHWDPNTVNLGQAYQSPKLSWNPSGSHWLGTDGLGRDEFLRVLLGARVSLLVGFVGATAAAVLGSLIGAVAALSGKVVGAVLMRIADLQLAFPFLIFAITMTSVLGSGLTTLLILVSVWSWGPYARVAEAMTKSTSQRDFVLAARSVGAGSGRVLFRHILPQLMSPMLILWSFSFAILIILEASLSFLGMGIRPPTASWGTMLADGRLNMTIAWWLALFPGLAISLTVWSINSIGDRLRDVLDPRIQL